MSHDDHLRAIGKGWHQLVKPLLTMADAYGLRVAQVKEKFGTLRFYYDGHGNAPEHFDRAVRAAEALSARTCEGCGADGAYMTKAEAEPGKRAWTWVKTYCETCHANRKPGG